MQKANLHAGAIAKELREAMEARGDLREAGAINDLLEMLVKRRDLDVLDAVLDLLSGLQIQPDAHSYELLIEAHVLLKNFNEVKSLAARLRKNGVAFTEKMHRGVFTAALRTGQVQDAGTCLRTASFDLSPEQAKSFVSLCCKERCTDVLKEVPSVKRKDSKQCAQLSELVSAFGVPKTGQVLVLLARGCPMQASALFEAAGEVSESAALALLEACASTRDAELAGKVFAALEGRKAGSQLTGVGHP